MSTTAAAQINATDLMMFARLGIPAELLAQAGVRRVTDLEAREEFGIRGDGNMDGIIFLYFDPFTGSRVTARLRRDAPEIVEGKPKRKYVCPYGDRRLLYFSPGAAGFLADPNVPIVLVEAEKSALALTAWAARRGRRILAVALGGAWGWRAKTGKTSNTNGKRVDETGPTPGLQYASKGRQTFILLDANAATNEDVRYARSKLVQQLNKQDAGVVVLDLPSIPGVNGPDDFISLCGDEAMALVFEWKPQADGSGTVDWPDPKPIQAELRPVVPFDPDALLPDALRLWVMDEADRMPCAPDFVAAAAIVTLGAIIGARCAIKPKAKDDWLVVPNLWGGLVGLPSAKKSPAIGAALKPLDRLIAQAIEAHKAELEAFEASKTAFEARKEALEQRIKAAAKAKGGKAENLESVIRELNDYKRSTPCTPILRRYKTNDSTSEKLGELLRENPFGLLVLRDELVGLLVSWEREGREGDRAFFLESWNGVSSFDTDRIARGSISIPNLCLAILGGIQPDKLTSYLEQAANALANDGMLQRFQILVYPDHRPWEWRDRTPDNQARSHAFVIFETLAGFDAAAWGASPAGNFAKFPYFSFDPAAQEIFIEWSTDLHRVRLRAEDHPIIAQHLAKFDKLFPALALILHLVDCAATSEQGPVSAKAALRAAAWCDFLESHARRCYALLMDDGLRAALALANKVRQNKLPDGFTARDVRRNQWRSLTTDESVEAAIAWLEDEGWLRATQAGSTGPGRRTNHYFVNPKIQRTAKGCTANTAENSNSSVLAVPCPDISGDLEEDGE